MDLILNFAKKIYGNNKKLLAAIFILSLFCSLIFLLFLKNIGPVQHRIPGSDYLAYYEPMAYSIIRGEGITLDGKVLPWIAPGWPVILSVIFSLSGLTGIDRLFLIVVFNVMATALACCLLFFIAKEIFSKRVASISAFLWMTYPFNLWFLKNPNTEVPFIPLFFGAVFLCLLAIKQRSIRFIFLSGIFFGLASLTRLIALFFPIFLALLIFFILTKEKKKTKIILATALLAGYFLTLLPWGIYTSLKEGTVIPVSDLKNNGIYYGIILMETPGGDSGTLNLSPDVLALIGRLKNENPRGNVMLSGFFLKEMLNNPSGFFKLVWLKLSRPWYATSKIWWEGKILAVQLFYLITAFSGILYAVKKWKGKNNRMAIILSAVFYFWILASLVVSILRYMVPVMGFLMIFSAITVGFMIDKALKRKLILYDG